MLSDEGKHTIEDARACGDDETSPASAPPEARGLSTDYLNHYSEILMLIEMAAFDPTAVAEIAGWRPIGYRAYFEKSPLRRAASAIDAYDSLPEEQRAAFERNLQALDKLAEAAILALQPPCHPQNVVLIADAIGPAIRRQIGRAASFLNSGFAVMPDDGGETQAIIDRLIA